MSSQPASRRTVIRGAVVAGVAGAAGVGLTGCGSAINAQEATMTPTAPVTLGSAEDVPVGGAKLYRDQHVLVSRPTKDEYKAFSGVCTHGRCALSQIEGGEAVCPCHGSRFEIKEGKPVQGPAVPALPAVPVRVEGGNLIAG
jgi:nitrite reductase/ring-hydroxylating ferredoxin subunit